ncbi:gliding motility-associated C-terminal domain-containing protein [bacterium]|nr:gliding motility-associated C-terminal domain-containing protein [bacterium]
MTKRQIYLFTLTSLLILLYLGTAFGQFTNLGKVFYFCYPSNAQREPHSPPEPPSFFNGILILTSSFDAAGTVRNNDGSFNVPFFIPANSTVTIVIDSTHWLARSEVALNKGLKVESDTLITAYFLAYQQPGATNDMALLFPQASLGMAYRVLGWPDNIPTYPLGIIPTRQYDRGPSMFAIVATENNTRVSVTPTVNTQGGHLAGVTFSTTLQEYQAYQVLANTQASTYPFLYDLTGSLIEADKPIAVIAGSQIALVPDSIMAADYLIEMMPPLTAWGMTFNAFPIQQRNSWHKDVLRILAAEDATSITITDGSGVTPANLNAGEVFEWNGVPCEPGGWLWDANCDNKCLDSPTYIESDKPILVAQYIMGGTMTSRTDFMGYYINPLGDPAYMLVPPIEQYARRYVFLTPSGYNNDFLNVAIPSGHEGSIILDGAPPTYSTPWFNIPVEGYRGAVISLSPGSHILEADVELMLQMYGYDNTWASYATIAGQNLLPINAEYMLMKYCLTPTVQTGTQATWRIVIYNFRGDPSTQISVVDSLPTGFSMSSTPPTYELYGAVRDSIMDPSPGETILNFGYFSMTEGDSIVIIFTADIEVGIAGIFDNAFSVWNQEGHAGGNFGGRGPEDDVEVIVPLFHLTIIQPFDGAYVACIDQFIEMTIIPSFSAVNPASILFEVTRTGEPPDTFYSTPGLLYFHNDTLTFDPPPGYYEHGDTVYVCLIHVEDTMGYEMPFLPFCWEFYIDFEPPVAFNFNVEPGDTITDSLQIITFYLIDSLTGVNPGRITVTIDGVPYGPPAITYAGDSLVINPGRLGINWFDYSEVEICLYVEDYPDYCENILDTCFIYGVIHSVPVVEIIMPLDSTITSCFDQEIVVHIVDTILEIDPGSIILEVAGISYTIGPYLDFRDSILTFSPPMPGFANNETVLVRLINVTNIIGTPPDSMPIVWEFYVDLEAPHFSGLIPPPGSLVHIPSPDIHLYVTDNLAGVNPDSIRITLNGSLLPPANYTFTDSLLQLVGITFTETETIEVCVYAEDMPDYCPPNGDEICWWFVVALTAPEAVPFYPLAGEITACDPDSIVILLTSEDGEIDQETIEIIINGILYTIDSPYLSYDPLSQHLTFFPPAGFFSDDDSLIIQLQHARNEYGVDLTEPLIYTIYVDYTPPDFWNIIPLPGSIVSVPAPTISFNVSDNLSGLNEATLLITINDSIQFMIGDPGVEWSAPSLTLDTESAGYYFTDGDTLQICVFAEDMPDYCGPNSDSLCWELYINLARPSAILLEPLENTYSACEDQEIIFRINSSNGVDESSIRLWVEDIEYSTADPELEYLPGTRRLVFSPSPLWNNGDSVEFCITDLLDTLGHELMDTVCGNFIVDLTAPSPYAISPVPNTLLNDSMQIIQFCLFDSLAGIAPNSIRLTVNGISYNYNYDWVITDTCLEWNPGDHGIVFNNWDTVEVCLETRDAVDYCEPNELDSCWYFVVHTEGPTGEIITPRDGWYSACNDQGITFILYDDLYIEPASVTLTVNGIDYNIDSTGLTHAGDTFFWAPAEPWDNGDTIFACITEGRDSIGNPLTDTVCIEVIIDLQPPLVLNTWPTHLDSITDITPLVIIDIFDSLAGLNPDSLEININGDLYHIGSTGFSWADPTLRINFDILPYELVGGDSVRICLHSIDLVDTCGPNEHLYCFTFYISSGGPAATVIRPLNDTYSACPDEHIVLYIEDVDGVDPSSVLLEINSSLTGPRTFLVDGAVLIWDDSLLYLPAPPWSDGESLSVCLLAANDSLGNPLEDAPVCWDFIIDLSPPVFSDEWPADGEAIPELAPVVSVSLLDILSGLDMSSIHFNIDGLDYYLSHAAVNLAGDTLSIDFRVAGLELSGCDTVNICAYASDQPDYCEPNAGELCWTFFIPCGGPLPRALEPPALVYSSCPDQAIAIAIIDTDGVAESTIILEVAGVVYTLPDPHLSWTDDSLLIFIPSPYFADGDTITIRLLEVEDDLGNPMTGTLEWTFYIDLTPPVLSALMPPNRSIVADSFQIISLNIFDSLSGLDWDTVRIIINGIEYEIGSPAISWDGSTLIFNPSAIGTVFHDNDTVIVCVPPQYDLAELCGPNHSDTLCWEFYIRLFGPVAELIQYEEDLYVACEHDSQLIIVIIRDDDGVEEDSILFSVNEELFTVDDPELDFVDSLLFFTPSVPWADGEIVEAELIDAPDIYGSPLSNPFAWSFIMDLSSPVISNLQPDIGEVVTSVTATISFYIEDLLSGYDTSSITVILNGTGFSITELLFDGDSVLLIPDSLGVFLESDTNTVCVNAADLPDYCSPNLLDTCWLFIVSTGGPIGEIRIPRPDSVSACPDQEIIVRLTDPDTVDRATIFLEVQDSIYNIDDTELDYDGEFLTFIPALNWVHGETVRVVLREARDLYGNTLETMLNWSFVVDLLPPYPSNLIPGPGDTVSSIDFDLCLELNEDIAGIDTASFRLIHHGDTMDFTDPCLEVHRTLEPSGRRAILQLQICDTCFGEINGGDWITICVEAEDQPEYCDANRLDSCWTFLIQPGGPLVELLSPLDNTYSSCDTQVITLYISDENGVNESSIILEVAGVSYTMAEYPENMLFFADTLRLTVPDSIVFSNGQQVNIILQHVEDNLGNEIGPLSWSYTIDYQGPQLALLEPPENSLISNHSPIILIQAVDQLSGLNPDAAIIHIQYGDTIHTFLSTSPGINFNSAQNVFEINTREIGLAIYDTIWITVENMEDDPDYCFPNISSDSWYFIVERQTICHLFPNPFTPNGDNYNERTYFIYPLMYSKEAQLKVYNLRNILVYETTIPAQMGVLYSDFNSWNGTDSRGNKLSPGIYLYTISVDSKMVCNGTVILAR